MRAPDPGLTFIIVLVIGLVAGFLFDRLAGPSWLARQFSGSNRGIITSALVGIAGALVGYNFGPVDLQVWATDSFHVKDDFGGWGIFGKLVFKLAGSDPVAPGIHK